ncbi:hypothetical protein VP1G_00701 [Cytospora mali]|uniref:DUF6604 domain-containing protein n=1 Tax=Cytospora mali TaxID=578113 RepID=A0A194UNH8_CYTMA|nr:hypothetical protein VP1G_00701 [Valsa mali var. pyri (nom. inval.)]
MDSSTNFRGGTWHRYKLGQAQFTKWLKQTAEKFTPTTASTAKGAGSLSTASKKSQKKAAKAGVDNDVAVHWRELEAMASNIVENAKPEDIPPAPLNILRDVIGLRKKSARFFSRAAVEEGNEGLRDKNVTHEHIIKVLERVLGKFESLVSKGTQAAKDMAMSASGIRMDLNDLNNMFEHLELQTSPEVAEEEVSSDVENQPEVSASAKKASKKSTKGGKKVQKGGKAKKQRESTSKSAEKQDSSWIDDVDFGLEYEDDDEEFDYYMMIYCFFEDFNLIRSYICERWCDYFYDRSISLNTLSVITNAAFELFHQMEHDLIIDMRRIGIRDRNMGSYEFMMMAIFTEFGMEHIDYDSYEALSNEESNERIWKDEWDWLASPAFCTVQQILRMIPLGKTPMVRRKDRTPPVYGGLTVRELESFKDVVITDLMLDVVCVKALKKNGGAPALLPAESELLLGFQDALRNYDFSSAFIFSMQLYCDIRYILEDTVVHPFEQLQKTAQRSGRLIPLMIERASGPRFELRRTLRQRQKELHRFMLNDVVMEDKLPRYLGAGLEEDDVEDFFLLKHEPVWAGLLDFRVKLVMNELGHEYVNRSFLVEAAAYLYAAARAASKQLPDQEEFPVWEDMEKFLASYMDDTALKRGILSGGDDPVAIIRNFKDIMPENAIDPKPNHAALDSVPGQTEEFKQSVRIRQQLSKRYASIDRENQFFMEYMRGLIQQRLEPELGKLESLDDMSAILQDISGNKYSGQAHSQGGPLPDARRELAAERRALKQKQQKRRALLAQLSPIQQIQILEDVVTEQLEGLLSIDFVQLFHTTSSLLYFVGMAHIKNFKWDFGLESGSPPSSVDDTVRVPLLLGEILGGDPEKDKEVLCDLVRSVRVIVALPGKPLSEDEEEEWEDEDSGDNSDD